MNTQFSVSLWRIGQTPHISMSEYDNEHKAYYRITYPLTYQEAADLGAWASKRIGTEHSHTFLNADGWSVWLPIDNVISDDIVFVPLHKEHRRDTINCLELVGLTYGTYNHRHSGF